MIAEQKIEKVESGQMKHKSAKHFYFEGGQIVLKAHRPPGRWVDALPHYKYFLELSGAWSMKGFGVSCHGGQIWKQF